MSFFRNYALSIILGAMFLLSWIGQAIFGWKKYQSEQQKLHNQGHILGDNGYVWQFLSDTFENWQSEFLQICVFIVLSAYFIHKNSPQSRDGEDEIIMRIKKIEKLLENKK
ncbi:MAG: exported protein of unknown function [Rickettsiaceae bacterium]|jgi:hypothetical protein|nr:exported protein of unknown function [Rickettsiaceae bacterium]